MDGLTIFFVIALAAAVFTTIYVFAKKRSEKEETPPKAVPTPPEVERAATAARAAEVEEAPPANVAVIYEALRSGAAKHCRGCGCEYASSATVCEICGEKL